MSTTIKPLHSDFGVELRGIQIARGLSDTEFAEIERAVEQSSVVVVPEQDLDDEGQLSFSRGLGELEFDHFAYGRDRSICYVGYIGNVGPNGEQLPAEHQKVQFGRGNEMWHSDSSFREVPSKLSISYAYEVSAQGGELEFVSTRAAYERLPEALKRRIEDLVVIHDYVYSRSKVAAVLESHARSLPPVRQKLVRTNPVNGSKNYFVGSHARGIEGWEASSARALLDDLLERATRAQDVYQHRWRVGDLLIWDNRCVLHRGRPYDADRYRRRMHQTRVTCGCSSLTE